METESEIHGRILRESVTRTAGDQLHTEIVDAAKLETGIRAASLTRKSFKSADRATRELAERLASDMSKVEARWLGPVIPVFQDLLRMAQDGNVTDADLLKTLETASRTFPELFDEMATDELAQALESAMGAAMVNGATSRFDADNARGVYK